MVPPNPVETLTAINLDDLVNAFGWDRWPLPSLLVRRVFSGAARTFARQMLDFDRAVNSRGLAEAACITERLFVRDVRVFDADLLPDAPFLALSNHPGLTDTLALLGTLGRPDLKIIALDRPFLTALPNLSRQLFYITDEAHERVSLIRRVTKHLRDGGSILTFPAGRNEPDPDVFPGAVEALRDWTDSVGVFVRLAPETYVVPVCVRGVVCSGAARGLLSRLRRTQDERQLLVSALQLLSSILLGARPVNVKVQVGKPVSARILGSTDTGVVHRAILSEMRRMIENAPTGQGNSIL